MYPLMFIVKLNGGFELSHICLLVNTNNKKAKIKKAKIKKIIAFFKQVKTVVNLESYKQVFGSTRKALAQ